MFGSPVTTVSRGRHRAIDAAALKHAETAQAAVPDTTAPPHAGAVNDRSQTLAIVAPDRCILEGHSMAKGNNSKRGNKETKKPKQEKPKVLATANSLSGKNDLSIGGKKPK
ncbi:hypothetical protein [Pseudosulfitobacter sp. DSM 107133]|uniref:hypothetical protein n=1 Tax=Pseudosulfitobacter sp. DSM 107133 TaxID=2883100 RepID=UPI000DF2BFE6|nr:hypothetical protein [Pseudosulfitobacter sp. DSM 107133]UOA28622.1 hypothetical protein DSM107133_03372 [Pseudosulfitobacter sp. DSM 107133]